MSTLLSSPFDGSSRIIASIEAAAKRNDGSSGWPSVEVHASVDLSRSGSFQLTVQPEPCVGRAAHRRVPRSGGRSQGTEQILGGCI